MVRIHFEGRSYDLFEYELDVIPSMTDHEIRRQIARFFAVRADRLRDYIIDRAPNGHLTVRPESVYGRLEENSVTLMTL
jgi:hypothetical protein